MSTKVQTDKNITEVCHEATVKALSTKTESKHTVGDTPWHSNGRALMIHDKAAVALAAVVVNGNQMQIRDLIVRAVNSHDDLVAACEALVKIETPRRGRCDYCRQAPCDPGCPVGMARSALAKARS